MKKSYGIVIGFVLVVALSYWIGYKNRPQEGDVNFINEIHFKESNNLSRSEPTFQKYLLNILRDSLKNKRKYDEGDIQQVIKKIEDRTHLKNYIKIIKVDFIGYKILISQNGPANNKEAFFILTRDSVFYAKMFSIVRDREN
ncbi:hypothetical protein HQ865_11240 [Mucilaginibacter mali]|uniref:Uncharacterized protein n=1 Tax=Mucilaginibacter mali TaxID=2740462 RepID=A0A7D4QK95_9SPHI|nr:hypothetical protein [Mucilaginibacter mali]QKJ30310.1 hypothetical protein HQ865_11240 [Mucilaginibacter mali]